MSVNFVMTVVHNTAALFCRFINLTKTSEMSVDLICMFLECTECIESGLEGASQQVFAEIQPNSWSLLQNVKLLSEINICKKHLVFNQMSSSLCLVCCFYTNGRLSMANQRRWTKRSSDWNLTFSAIFLPVCCLLPN